MRRVAAILLVLAGAGFASAAQDPALPHRTGSLKFAAMGDNGTGEAAEYEVARQMASRHGTFPFELVIMLGEHIEHALWTPVQVVLFLFAFVNAGVVVHGVERGAWAVTAGALIGRPAGMLAAVAVALTFGLRLPRGVGWRELIVIALAVSCTFTFGLFFATAMFATGPVLTESKVAAPSTIAGGPIAAVAASILAVRHRR